jgi:sugar O-acyltransferase (sialic acid O-acetyltransferase NeuD family)
VKDLVIFGAGGFAREAKQVVDDMNQDSLEWNFIGFLDSDPVKHAGDIHGYPILGGPEWLAGRPGMHVVVGLGAPAARCRVVTALRAGGCSRFATLVHPRAIVGRHVSVGPGTVICGGVGVDPDVTLGAHVILNLNCTVGHDSVFDDFVTLAPGVNVPGRVRIGEGCDIGTGAAIVPGVTMGAWAIVGAGAVVTRDLPANVTAVGVPAGVRKVRLAGWHEQA